MHILLGQQAHADRALWLKVAFDDAVQSCRNREGGACYDKAGYYKKKNLKNTKKPWIIGGVEIIPGW